MVRRVPTLKTAIAIASAPVTNAVAQAIRNDMVMLEMATPPKICVMAKMGMPLTSRATTKNSRESSEPSTICPLVSGVARRMS